MRAQDPHSQIENDEIPGGEYPNENDSEVTRTNKTSAIPNFIPQILPDDEIAKDTNCLNSEQREVFNEVHTWAKDYVKYDGFDVEPADIFLSSSVGTGKSLLMKVIYNAISKILLYLCKHREKPRVLLLAPTGISAVNIRETIINSGLGVKPGTKLFDSNGKSKASLRNRLSEVKLVIIDKLSVVSNDLWTDIDSRLGEIFMMIPEQAFPGVSVMPVADLLQLPPVRGKIFFFQFLDKNSMKQLLDL